MFYLRHSVVNVELIDTQWDVNNRICGVLKADGTELIDTQWDVNLEESTNTSPAESELIDTQWDVNQGRSCIIKRI